MHLTVTMADLYSSNSSGLLCGPAAHAPTHTRRPSGLLVVHAVLTLTVEVWLCGMTRI